MANKVVVKRRLKALENNYVNSTTKQQKERNLKLLNEQRKLAKSLGISTRTNAELNKQTKSIERDKLLRGKKAGYSKGVVNPKTGKREFASPIDEEGNTYDLFNPTGRKTIINNPIVDAYGFLSGVTLAKQGIKSVAKRGPVGAVKQGGKEVLSILKQLAVGGKALKNFITNSGASNKLARQAVKAANQAKKDGKSAADAVKEAKKVIRSGTTSAKRANTGGKVQGIGPTLKRKAANQNVKPKDPDSIPKGSRVATTGSKDVAKIDKPSTALVTTAKNKMKAGKTLSEKEKLALAAAGITFGFGLAAASGGPKIKGSEASAATKKGKKASSAGTVDEMNAPMKKSQKDKIGTEDPSAAPALKKKETKKESEDVKRRRKSQLKKPKGRAESLKEQLLIQGKREYDTPFGKLTVDSTDEGMDTDRANFKYGGMAFGKGGLYKAPKKTYGMRNGGFTRRGASR